MDILIVTTSFPQYPGDYSGIFIYNQIKPLARKHNIHVIYLSKTNKKYSHPGLYLYPIEYPFKTYPLSQLSPLEFYRIPILYKKLAKSVKAIVHKEGIDIVHAHWLFPTGYIVHKELNNNIPLVITAHGSDVNKFLKFPLAGKFIKEIIENSTKIIAVSRALKYTMIKKTNASADKISVVYNGVDTNLFRPPKKKGSSTTFKILYVGSLFKVKRVDRLIRGVSMLDNGYKNNIEIIVIGDGPERGYLESLSKKLGANIIFVGKKPYHMIPEYMKKADLLVLPSDSEGFPSVIVEALACGVPVIASDVGGIKEAVVLGKTGYLIPLTKKYEKLLSETLIRYIENKNIHKKHKIWSRKVAERKFSLSVISKQLEYTYRNLSG